MRHVPPGTGPFRAPPATRGRQRGEAGPPRGKDKPGAQNVLTGLETGAEGAGWHRDPKPHVDEKQESRTTLPGGGHQFPGTPTVQGHADTQ